MVTRYAGNAAPYTTGGIGTANVTGTSAALGSQACRSVTMTANPANTGTLWIAVGATAVIGSGTPLPPGQPLRAAVSNLSMINAIAATPGDDLCYQWVN